jgi:hypothetical protein
LAVLHGIQTAGGLSEIQQSDDLYAEFSPIAPSNTSLSGPTSDILIEFEGALSTDSPGTLAITVEASATEEGPTQTIEMFNWNTGQYQVVDSRSATANSDSSVYRELTDSITDFVQPVTGSVKARVGWKTIGFGLSRSWTARVDQIVWTTTD